MEDYQNQQAELVRLRRLIQLKKSYGLLFYKPHARQQAFHEAANFKLRYLRTGNRFGKSTCGAAEDVSFALGYRPWYPEGHPMRTLGIPHHSTKGLIIVADWDKAREIYTSQLQGQSLGKLFRFIPAEAFEGVHKNQAGEIDSIFVKSVYGGLSTINLDTVKSFKSNPLGQESSDWDWIHVDEPCPEDMWVANKRGLVDREGSAWFTCTPITEMWINDLFIPTKRIREEFTNGFGDEARSTWLMTGSMTDNPHNTKKAVDQFMVGLSEADIDARIKGRPLQLAGAVYSEFDEFTHKYHTPPHGWVDNFTPPPDYSIRLAIDTHPKNPHAVLFSATSPQGYVYFYNEIYEHCYIDQLCDRIFEKLDGKHPVRVFCDRLAFQESPVDGSIWANVFWQRGLAVEPAIKALRNGIQEVKRQLKTPNNWFFNGDLHRVFYEFDRYVWDPKKEAPIDKDDHIMECLYRLSLHGLDYVEPTMEKQEKYDPLDLSDVSFDIPGFNFNDALNIFSPL